MKSILIIFSIILLRCCVSPTVFQMMASNQNNNNLLKELHGDYQIISLKNKDISAYNSHVVFNNQTKQISGFSSCNRFLGTFSLNKNTLSLNIVNSTKKLCKSKINTIEKETIEALNKADYILFIDNGFSISSDEEILLSAVKKVTTADKISIEYTASSRGLYNNILIKEKIISMLTTRGGKPVKNNCKDKDWDKLKSLVKHIDVENISNLKAPTKAFLYDGAAMAKLKIVHNGTVYETKPFDHGNPPKDIEMLVKEITTMSQNIE
ncbi:META domain-containing protein [uncultured Algibacter sp.]|uniref:META domain-containing protein n=1 Tax=uncultured Algibacter sp. TaxID=298659 RepID=UPI003217D090